MPPQPNRSELANAAKKQVAATRQKAAQGRPVIGAEEKIRQQLLAKIKRLNLKLSKAKSVAVSMEHASTRNNEVSARQVESWAKDLINIINN